MSDESLLASLASIADAMGTRKDKRLPVAVVAPDIPSRVGAGPHVTIPVAPSSGSSDLVLDGAKTITSTDGLITVSYPQSAKVTIGSTEITIPAIAKVP